MKIFKIGFSLIAGFILLTNFSTSESAYGNNSTDVKATENVSERYSDPVVESFYKGNQLSNGVSPLDACFGKVKYAGKAWIELRNDYDADAIICLVSLNSGRVIRNEYI